MARDTDGIIQEKFAENGDVSLGDLVLTDGWPLSYSTPGGKNPQRLQFNQLYQNLFALGKEINQKGPFLEYSSTITYKIYAQIIVSGIVYISLENDNLDNDPLGNPAKWFKGSSSIILPFNTIAELRLANGALLTGDTIGMVNGYNLTGDGGGGDFYWDATSTEVDNGGTIIKVTAINDGRWKRIYSGAVNVSWFGDNTSSDTIQAAIDALPVSGGTIIFTTAQHTITVSGDYGVRIDKSNIKFVSSCNTEFIHDGSDIDGLWFGIGVSSVDDSFTQVHNISFDGLKLTGSATSTSVTQAAIYVKVPSTTYTTNSDSCFDIRVTDCEIFGFTMGVYFRSVYRATIDHNRMGANVFIPGLTAGGYCVLLETSHDVKVHHNDFISDTSDRHAVYVSIDQAKTGADIQCKSIKITDNYIDWANTIEGTNGFRQAMNIRATNGLDINRNTILSPMQYGISATFADGDGSDYNITGNIIIDVRVIAGSTGGGIVFTGGAGSGINAIIINNTVTESSSSTDGFYGIQVSKMTTVLLGNNIIEAEKSNSLGILIADSTSVIIEPNNIELNSIARSGVAFQNTCDDISVHLQDTKNPAISKIESLGSPTLSNMKYLFNFEAQITSDGIGGIVVSRTNGYNWIDTVVTSTYGCEITFRDFVTQAEDRLSAIGKSSVPNFFYLRSSTPLTQVLGVQDIAGLHTPLATNAATFLISTLDG